MRILLNIKTSGNSGKSVIPVNYQYPLSAWIYHTIAEGNHDFATFLHNSGFISGTKSFKFFTFSQLFFPPKGFKVTSDRLEILGEQCSLILSFMVPDAVEHFITGIFKNQKFSLGDQISKTHFIVNSVESLAEPGFSEEAAFRLLSPVVIGKNVEGKNTAEYLSPDNPDYSRIFTENLIHKFSAAINAGLINPDNSIQMLEPEISFTLLNTPRKRGITIKDGTPSKTKIIGYTYDFRLKAPAGLLKTGYQCGFGEKNSLGTGCAALI